MKNEFRYKIRTKLISSSNYGFRSTKSSTKPEEREFDVSCSLPVSFTVATQEARLGKEEFDIVKPRFWNNGTARTGVMDDESVRGKVCICDVAEAEDVYVCTEAVAKAGAIAVISYREPSMVCAIPVFRLPARDYVRKIARCAVASVEVEEVEGGPSAPIDLSSESKEGTESKSIPSYADVATGKVAADYDDRGNVKVGRYTPPDVSILDEGTDLSPADIARATNTGSVPPQNEFSTRGNDRFDDENWDGANEREKKHRPNRAHGTLSKVLPRWLQKR